MQIFIKFFNFLQMQVNKKLLEIKFYLSKHLNKNFNKNLKAPQIQIRILIIKNHV
jgi:hypothetical protein